MILSRDPVNLNFQAPSDHGPRLPCFEQMGKQRNQAPKKPENQKTSTPGARTPSNRETCKPRQTPENQEARTPETRNQDQKTSKRNQEIQETKNQTARKTRERGNQARRRGTTDIRNPGNPTRREKTTKSRSKQTRQPGSQNPSNQEPEKQKLEHQKTRNKNAKPQFPKALPLNSCPKP